MSKKPAKRASFNYKVSENTPKLSTYSTEWNLSKLYYKSDKDPQIEKDVAKAEALYTSFAKKWKNKDFTGSASLLNKSVAEYEALCAAPEIRKPSRYFSFRSTLNTNDSIAEKRMSLLSQRMRKASDQIVFFKLKIGSIDSKTQKKYLKDETLKHFHYFLERSFMESKHHLTEPEEKIIRLKSSQSYGMWVDAVEKIISNRAVTFKKKAIAIPEALETLNTLSSSDRAKLWDLILNEMQQIGEVAEHEFNAIITDARTEDDLRGFTKPYSSTALSYEDTEESIEKLVQAVSTEGFALSKKFYKLKAQFHGVNKLHYTDKYKTIGREVEIPFETALNIARDVFYGVKVEYGQIFDNMLISGQIDVYPRKGKRGGAFMSATTGLPTHVLLNHVNDFKSLETLAHEMGHAIHAERSKCNSPFYDDHSIVIAETASTLFENLLFNAVYAQAKPEMQIILLHDRITRDIATIQRQIAFFNAELEIHNRIYKEGAMTNAELANVMFRHLKSYLGNAIALSEKDGYSYVYIHHLRYGFYVYSYACGILMSNIMVDKYKDDISYVDQIDRFLCAGDSADVVSIYKIAGIDTTKKDTFSDALRGHRDDIKKFEQHVRNLRKV